MATLQIRAEIEDSPNVLHLITKACETTNIKEVSWMIGIVSEDYLRENQRGSRELLDELKFLRLILMMREQPTYKGEAEKLRRSL